MPQVAISCNVRKHPPHVLSGKSLHCLQQGDVGSFLTVNEVSESFSAGGLFLASILILAIQLTTFHLSEYRL